ncbi:MAG: hypothetical protein MJE66_05100 [Proteobacteria bacterium]|nr:hypothetical protein [Pseudomonadota bacterium]
MTAAAARRWRLVVNDASPGPFNMGVDEALLERARCEGVASLRFYRWTGPWLSLGYAQPRDPERLEAWRRAGVRVVGRVTGGRAVLHGSDLTYAVACPLAWLPEGLDGSVACLAHVLQVALRRLGSPVERAGRPSSARGGFDCFARPGADELVVRGRKLVGSAQRRVAGALLQHGSIRLTPDPPAAAAAVGVGAGATSLSQEGAPSDPARVRDACLAAFESELGAQWEPEVLPEAIRAAAHQRPVWGLGNVRKNPHFPRGISRGM